MADQRYVKGNQHIPPQSPHSQIGAGHLFAQAPLGSIQNVHWIYFQLKWNEYKYYPQQVSNEQLWIHVLKTQTLNYVTTI